MDFLTKVIKDVDITEDEKVNLQNSTFGLTIDESNSRIIGFLSRKISDNFDKVKYHINVSKFVDVINMEMTQEMLKYITMYRAISKYDFSSIALDVVSRVEKLCNGRQNYREYCYMIIAQMNVSISIRRAACVALSAFKHRLQFCKETLISCIQGSDESTKSGTIIDKFYCLSFLRFLYKYEVERILYDQTFWCTNDIRLLTAYDEHGFMIYGKPLTEISEDELQNLKELGMHILSSEHTPYSIIDEPYRRSSNLIYRFIRELEEYFVDREDQEPSMKYYATHDGQKFKLIMIDSGRKMACHEFSVDDYYCMVAYVSENYDQCLKYCSKDTDSLLMTMIANKLLSEGNEDVPDMILSFIADPRKFSIDIRIALAYSFKGTKHVEHLRQAHDILVPNFYRMEKYQKEKVRNLLS